MPLVDNKGYNELQKNNTPAKPTVRVRLIAMAMAMALTTAIAFNGIGVFPENCPCFVQAHKKDIQSFPVRCHNCHKKSIKCKACPKSKGSCQSCFLSRLECLFPISPYLHQKRDFFPFQCNCIHCTINHQRCKFDSNIHPQKCQ
jgi:hypothetical protein